MSPTSDSRARARRAQLLLVLLLLAPALLRLPFPGQGASENRQLAPLPPRPATLQEALKFSSGLDAWLNDHFRMRDGLVALNARLRYALFRQFPTTQVIAGKNERTFMATYQAKAAPYSGVFSACGYQDTSAPFVVDQVNRLMASAKSEAIPLKLLVVPSSPVVNVDQLDDWLARLCRNATPPMAQVLASPQLDPAARANVAYPLAAMRQASASADLFPRNFFHWGGTGPRLVAEWTVQQFWGTPPDQGTPVVSTRQRLPSDISHLFPGIALTSEVEVMDLKASGIDVCNGPPCFGAMQPVLAKFGEMALYRNPRAVRGRLVLISDSFGPPAAPWFARFYRETVLVNTNFMDQLDDADTERMRHFLFDGRAQDDVLVLFHDVTVHSARIPQDFKRMQLQR